MANRKFEEEFRNAAKAGEQERVREQQRHQQEQAAQARTEQSARESAEKARAVRAAAEKRRDDALLQGAQVREMLEAANQAAYGGRGTVRREIYDVDRTETSDVPITRHSFGSGGTYTVGTRMGRELHHSREHHDGYTLRTPGGRWLNLQYHNGNSFEAGTNNLDVDGGSLGIGGETWQDPKQHNARAFFREAVSRFVRRKDSK